MLIENIRLFAHIAECGSFVGAARRTGLSTTTVSERLATLEAHFGVVLINRTTRAMSLTEEGQLLLTGSKSLLGDMDALEAEIRHGARTLSGSIRISAPIDLGRSIIAKIVSDFTAKHPEISVEMILSDGFDDVVGQGIDMALRFGAVPDSSLRVRPVGRYRRIVCAAPSYLANQPTPQVPDDLARHNCLVMRFGETLDNVWKFDDDDKERSIIVRGDKIANDGALVREWALAGQGIILKSSLDVADDIREGRLVRLLVGYEKPAVPLQMLFAPHRRQARRIVAFADHVAMHMKKLK